MSAEEKEVEIRKGDTPSWPPTKPGEKVIEAGDVPHPLPEKPEEQPSKEPPKEGD